jgi:hypothetical protein
MLGLDQGCLETDATTLPNLSFNLLVCHAVCQKIIYFIIISWGNESERKHPATCWISLDEMLGSVFTITLPAPFVLALSTSHMMASLSLFYGSWALRAEFDLDYPVLVNFSNQSPQFFLILALHVPMMLPPAFLAYFPLAFGAFY